MTPMNNLSNQFVFIGRKPLLFFDIFMFLLLQMLIQQQYIFEQEPRITKQATLKLQLQLPSFPNWFQLLLQIQISLWGLFLRKHLIG